MSGAKASAGRAVVMQPGDGLSYWQPEPANGHVEVKLQPHETGFDGLSMGAQTIAPGGRVRAHSHDAQIEIQICFSGTGSVLADGVRHALVPGTTCFLGREVRHEIVNEGEDDLVMMWIISPPGLEDFFAAIGRPRRAGEAAPPPFDRPADAGAIDRAAGMAAQEVLVDHRDRLDLDHQAGDHQR